MGQQQDFVLGSALLSHICPPFLHQREPGSHDSHPSKGCLLAIPRVMSPELGPFHPEAWPLYPNDAHLLPRHLSYHFPSLSPNSPSSDMGRGPRRPEGETLLKEAERGWRERGHSPSEGFFSWRKDMGVRGS